MFDLLKSKNWRKELVIKNTVKALQKNGFEAIYIPTKEEAVKKILDLVKGNYLVGLGGSVTLREMGVPHALNERGFKVADHWEARANEASTNEILDLRRQQLNSDVFITSTNALTEKGELVNIDGAGQRVAAMIFGPKKVVIVAGANKIVKDLEEGFYRAQNIAAPINAKRLDRRTPCISTGVCSDCDSDDRICNVTTIIHRKPGITDATVIIVGEELGY